MKTRSTFVSNSSSSSFIIALTRKPENSEEVQKLFFSDGRGVMCDFYDEGISPENAAFDVFSQIERQEPMTLENITDELASGWYDGRPEVDWRNKKSNKFSEEYQRKNPSKNIFDDPEIKKKYWALLDEEWRQEDELANEAAKKLSKAFMDNNPDAKFYRLSYSDNDGSFGSTMEHGDLLRNVKHVKISHH